MIRFANTELTSIATSTQEDATPMPVGPTPRARRVKMRVSPKPLPTKLSAVAQKVMKRRNGMFHT